MSEPRHRFAGVQFDPQRGIEHGGRLIPLSAKERRLLAALIEAGGKLVSKDALVQAVWRGGEASDESISTLVSRVRRKLESAGAGHAVTTIYGGGFCMAVPISPVPEAAATTKAHAAARECLTTARELIGRRGLRDMISATWAARRAVHIAPDLVDAWVLLGQISMLRVNRGQIATAGIGVRRARWAAGKALALSPEADGALALLGWIVAVVDGDTSSGLALIDKAVAINDTDWATHTLRAWALHAARRREEGLGAFEAMIRCNPLPTFSFGTYGYALGCAGRFEQAFDILNRAIRSLPTVDSLLSARSSVAAMTGDFDLALSDAKRCAELAPDIPNQLYALACAWAAVGAFDKSRRTLERMLQCRCRLGPSWLALVLAGLGERTAAAEALRRARRERCTWLSFVQYDPRLQGLETDEAPAACAFDSTV